MDLTRSFRERGLESLVISRAPLLISFGARACPPWPGKGARCAAQVVNMAIDYHVYTIIAPSRADGLQMICGGQDVLSSCLSGGDPAWGDALALPHAIAKHFDIRDGLSVLLAPPVAPGVGLGLLGSLAVSLIKGLSYFCGVDLGPKDVMELACHIGAKDMSFPIHSHYQYASAYGGISASGVCANRVSYAPLHVSPETQRALEQGLMLFFAGRSSGAWLSSRPDSVDDPIDPMNGRKLELFHSLVSKLPVTLEQGDTEAFGDLLHQLWLARAALEGGPSVSPLDHGYQIAREHGALGGQGRTGDGAACLILYCPQSDQEGVTKALQPLGWQRWPLMLEHSGVQVFDMLSWQRPSLSSGSSWRKFSILEHMSLSQGAGERSTGS